MLDATLRQTFMILVILLEILLVVFHLFPNFMCNRTMYYQNVDV